MPMMNKDTILQKRETIRSQMAQALKDSDHEGYVQAFNSMLESVCEEVRAEYDQQLEEMRQSFDTSVLSARGVRQLTTAERTYYQKVAEAMKSKDPRQAIANLDLALPETVINSVFDDLEHNHPLLSRINFMAASGAVEILMNTNGYQAAVWGELCDEIVKELSSGFVTVNTSLYKLSAFMLICKAMLDLGAEWLDRYIRGVLYEALANGMEVGIVTGTGKNMPIGMIRKVGAGVSVIDGEYPEKDAIPVTDFSVTTLGSLLAQISVDASGFPRNPQDVIVVVNPVDYFQKVMPATTIMAPDGTYRRDVMPYPMTIIPSPAITTQGKAVFGDAKRYFAIAGTDKEGRIEYSDHVKFLEDKRAFIIKAYANGMPKDNSSFLLLDISGLQPLTYKVELVEAAAATTDAGESEAV